MTLRQQNLTRSWFSIVFLAGGLFTVLLTLLPSLARPKSRGLDPLFYKTIPSSIFLNPGVFFAFSMILSGAICLHCIDPESELRFSAGRVALAGVLTAFTYPAMLITCVVVGLFLSGPPDYKQGFVLPLWRTLLSRSAILVAAFAGTVVAVCLTAVAFRVCTLRWPGHPVRRAVMLAVGVPTIALVFGSLWERRSDFSGALFEPVIAGAPFLLLLGVMCLALLVAQWFYEMTTMDGVSTR